MMAITVKAKASGSTYLDIGLSHISRLKKVSYAPVNIGVGA